MDKVSLLCEMQKFMLVEFQQRTLELLQRQRIIRPVLGSIQALLTLQITSQVDRSRQIIEHAASLVQSGTFPTRQDAQRLLAMNKNMDQVYIENRVIYPASLELQLPLIEPIRERYIQFVLNETHQLLQQWQGMHCLRNALALQYDIPQFSKLLYDMLHSIGLESRLLGRVMTVPFLIRLMRETTAQTTYLAMDSVAHALANELAHRLFRSRV